MRFRLFFIGFILIGSLSVLAQQNLTPASVSVNGPVTAVTGNFTGANVGGVPVGLSIPGGTPTYTVGTGVTSVACTSGYTCTNTRGDITIMNNTATTGTIATVNFSAALSTAPGNCVVNQNGGAVMFGLGHGVPSTTAFTITAGITFTALGTVSVDYSCQP